MNFRSIFTILHYKEYDIEFEVMFFYSFLERRESIKLYKNKKLIAEEVLYSQLVNNYYLFKKVFEQFCKKYNFFNKKDIEKINLVLKNIQYSNKTNIVELDVELFIKELIKQKLTF